jgi:hypothetical protein
MKTTKRILLTLAIVVVSAVQSLAIEGLKLSVQCSNVVLHWPSVEGQTYMVQYRPTLDPATPWQTLTNSYPADSGTNVTFFVHSNIVLNPVCNGGSFSMMMMSSGGSSDSEMTLDGDSDVPMLMRADGSGSAVPLALYPPGFDVSGYIIFDPSTAEWVSGVGYTTTMPSLMSAFGLDSPDPTGGGSAGAGADSSGTPDMGFYQVVQNGVKVLNSTLTNLTSGVVSNAINIGFEAANYDMGTLEEATVLVDGTRCRGVTPLIAPGISGTLQLDTSFLENGDHTFQVSVGWQLPDGTDFNNDTPHAYSDSFTLTVSNVIYYPNWEEEVGELGFAFYSFETTCTNSTWQIDIYDVSNNLAKTLTGNTGDGLVETNWNLVDMNGATRTNDYDTEFTAFITVGDPTTKKAPKQKKPIGYPAHGRWAIAYQDAFGNFANSNAYYTAIYSFGSIGAQFGGAVTVSPTPGHPELGQTFPLRYKWTNNPSPPTIAQKYADEQALVRLLTNSLNRNFLYVGHGSGNGLISIDLNALTYYLDKHYYRFVFLKGCSTATGGLPAAFGNNCTSPQDLSYFQKHGIRPRTFLGNNSDVFFANVGGNFFDPDTGQTYPGKVAQRVVDFFTNFEFYWYFNYDVTTSIFNAENDTPDLRVGWDDGPNYLLFGYPWLRVDDYNYQSNWQN